MPQPTASDLLVSVPLTNISTAYIAQAPMVSDVVFPVVPVDLPGGKYWKYNKEDWKRIMARPRAGGTESAGSGFALDQGVYSVTVDAIHKDIDDQTRATLGPLNGGFNLDRSATLWCTQQLLLLREQKWANAYFVTGVWGTDLTGVTGTPTAGQFKQWDQTGSTPIEDVFNQTIAIAGVTGYKPNVLVLSPSGWKALANHAEILERIKYSQTGIITEELVARAMGVARVVVGWSIYETANEGAVPQTYAFQLGKHALLVYAAPNPSLLEPTGGYQFAWTGYLGTGAAGNRIKTFRLEREASDRVEGEMACTPALIAADVGTFFSGVVA